MKNIGVIFGGKSSEHDISIISACALMQNLDKKKFNIIPIYVSKSGEFLFNKNFSELKTFQTNNKIFGDKICFLFGNNKIYIQKGKRCKTFLSLDFCFVVMHGINGEDGSVSAILNLCNIPYSCSDILASSVAMDKIATNIPNDIKNRHEKLATKAKKVYYIL